MKQRLDIDNWARKEHFQFFGQFDEPFYGVTVNIDCTKAYYRAKQTGASFFLYYLHKVLAAANTVEPFRYRIEGNEVFIYDTIHAGPTIARDNGTFGFAVINYYPQLDEFIANGKLSIEKVKKSTELFSGDPQYDIIHFSSLPWINFTSISHARKFNFPDSSPKVSVGKMTEENRKLSMPVSIHVNHALVDGIHLGQFIDLFQELMNQ